MKNVCFRSMVVFHSCNFKGIELCTLPSHCIMSNHACIYKHSHAFASTFFLSQAKCHNNAN